ncbi:ABC transporter ATP-binding protein [Granulicatella sp. zg-84]|uniref:ABC transporter ATP-binding protein n=1 Tax=Granulicatella sp. zg-84 TaxID=2678503 RepID=UPI001F0789DD|nr:ABC transporter ATP-binding protein [Granulicatella sp. zg-84]
MKKNKLWVWTHKMSLGVILVIASSLTNLIIPLFLRKVVDSDTSLDINSLGILIGMLLLQALILSFGNYVFAVAGENQVASLRKHLISQFYSKKMSFFHYRKSGELASRIVNDTLVIRDFLIKSIPQLVASIIILIGTVSVLLYLDWKLSLVLIITLPIMALLIIPISNISEKANKSLQEETSLLSGNIAESFQEIEMIKANVAEKSIATKQEKRVDSIRKHALKTDLVLSFESPFALLFIFGVIAIVFLYGGQRVALGDLSVGTLVSFIIYLLQLLNPIGTLSSVSAEFAKQKGATTEIMNLLEIPSEEYEGTEISMNVETIQFKDVSFSYSSDKPVLDKVNLIIKPYQKIAIVGPSGAGKSTIINLLLRFYDITGGSIEIGEKDIYQYDLRNWRQLFALVAQSNAVLSGTIRENLCFGIDKLVTDKDLDEALSMVSLTDEIKQLSEGLNSQVGENGKLLSGGQKQRLQIARAYLKDSPYILFDEATANLDADAEYKINQSLKKLKEYRTIVVIAHRLSTVVDADQIYFLENNCVTGQGRHEELLQTHETYARFVSEQMI